MKTTLSLLIAFFVYAVTLGAETSRSCCAQTEKAPAAIQPQSSCCSEGKGEGLTRGSVYQLETRFTDDHDATWQLRELRGRPVLVTMFFASCTSACPLLLADIAQIRARLPEAMRDDLRVVLVSFDGRRDTVEALKAFRESRGLDKQCVLLRANEEGVAELAAVLGIKYALQTDGQYAHSNVLTVLDAEGEIAFQRTGLKGDHARILAALKR